ncbi:MAG: hypothetical protein ASARMPREDX12_005452 [Alectoria sarmentosa]|nr:MAG: hypothetical protein ASARMPREDX12_005452 [Alectoria sarmentosa]
MYQRSLIPTLGDGMGITIVVVLSLCYGLATVAIGIRLWSRKIKNFGLFLNDYAAVLGWFFSAGLLATAIISVQDGGGKHMMAVNPANIPNILKTFVVGDLIWIAACVSIKISIIHFYISIFGSNKTFRRAAYAVMAIAIAYAVGVLLENVLICRPFAKNWYPHLPGHCGNDVGNLIAASACNVAIDLTIIALPIPMIWSLHMATRRKVELTITFALGVLICAVTIIRLVLATRLNMDDFTYDIARIGMVSMLEPLLGITIACLPLFPPAFKKVTGRLDATGSGGTPNVLSSSVARLRAKRSKNSDFEKFNDSDLLTDLEENRIENHISGPKSQPDYAIDGGSPFADFEVPPLSAIKVEQDWEVRSDEQRHPEAKV